MHARINVECMHHTNTTQFITEHHTLPTHFMQAYACNVHTPHAYYTFHHTYYTFYHKLLPHAYYYSCIHRTLTAQFTTPHNQRYAVRAHLEFSRGPLDMLTGGGGGRGKEGMVPRATSAGVERSPSYSAEPSFLPIVLVSTPVAASLRERMRFKYAGDIVSPKTLRGSTSEMDCRTHISAQFLYFCTSKASKPSGSVYLLS